MAFEKLPKFSLDPKQGGGELGSSNSLTYNLNFPTNPSDPTLTEYVVENFDSVVFCRYGLEYLKQFPRDDEMPVCSFNIDMMKKLQNKENFGFLKRRDNAKDNKVVPFKAANSVLEFDSAFESGNLCVAVKSNPSEYNLLL